MTGIKLFFENSFNHDIMLQLSLITRGWTFIPNNDENTMTMYCNASANNWLDSNDWAPLYEQTESNNLINANNGSDGDAIAVSDSEIFIVGVTSIP